MKKKRLLLIPCIIALLLLTGCEKEGADDAIVTKINALKREDTEPFETLLNEGIKEPNESYVLQFPDELKKTYVSFLQQAFNRMEFEISKPKKQEDKTQVVTVSFQPISIGETMKDACQKHLDSMSSADLTQEMKALLEAKDSPLKGDPVFQGKTSSTFHLKKTDKGYTFAEKELNAFLKKALVGYMKPYESVCEILDIQDFMTSYLNASFKGDVTNFALHTDRTEEEALAWYESDTFTPPSDLSSDYAQRYQDALKNILKQSQYTVGIPKKVTSGYTVEVTLTPNNSFVDAFHEFEQGTYYSIEEASAGLVQAMEKYAATPTYGAETSMTITLNTESLLLSDQTESEMQTLAQTILPIPS